MREGGVRTPVVFLTARDATDDKIRGLTLGGDDYVTKPFSLEELTARIRAVLRRTAADEPASARLTSPTWSWTRSRTRCAAAAQPVSLSPTEFKLLRYLMLNAGRVLSKAQILDHVWHYDFRGDDSIVESYISYLRRKVDIGRAAADPHPARRRLRPAPAGGMTAIARPRAGGRRRRTRCGSSWSPRSWPWSPSRWS